MKLLTFIGSLILPLWLLAQVTVQLPKTNASYSITNLEDNVTIKQNAGHRNAVDTTLIPTITNMQAQIADSTTQLDSLTMVSDTTALKQRLRGNGSFAYLQRLGSDDVGGGMFVVADSAYPEGGIAFDHPTTGKQWVRVSYLRDKIISITDYGAMPCSDSVETREQIQKAIHQAYSRGGGIVFIPPIPPRRYISGCGVGRGAYIVSKKPGYRFAIELEQLVHVKGALPAWSGVQGSAIRLADDQDSCFVFATSGAVERDTAGLYTGDGSDIYWNGGLENVAIDCNGEHNKDAGGIDLCLPGEASYVRDIHIGDPTGTCIRQWGGAPGYVENITSFLNEVDSTVCAYESWGGNCRWINISGDDFKPFFRHIGGTNLLIGPKMEDEEGYTEFTPVIEIYGDTIYTGYKAYRSAMACDSIIQTSSTQCLHIIGGGHAGGTSTKGVFLKINRTNHNILPRIKLDNVAIGYLKYYVINPASGDTILASYSGPQPPGYDYSNISYFDNTYRVIGNGFWRRYEDSNHDYQNFFRPSIDQLQFRYPFLFSILDSSETTIGMWTQSTFGFYNKVKIGENGVGIDSVKVQADTLLFYVGSTAYKAIKQ